MPDAFSHSIRLSVTPSEAWPRLQEATTWAGIAGIESVSDAKHDQDGVLESFDFVVLAAGSRINGTATRVDHTPEESLEMAISSSEIVGGLTARLAANEASGTRLRIMLEMKAKGFLAGMFYPLIAQTVARNLPEQVEQLGRRLEG